MKFYLRMIHIVFSVCYVTARTCITMLWRVRYNALKARIYPKEYWAPRLLKLAHVDLKIEGVEHLDVTQPYIFVMNHQSMIDIPCAYHALPVSICFVVKQELRKIPLFGRAMHKVGMPFVDRRNPQKAYQSLLEGAKLIQSGVNIMAFPEGTRNKDGVMTPFKKGIFVLAKQAQVPIVPMAIEGAQHVLTKKGLLQPNHAVILKIGLPITADQFEDQDELSLKDFIHQEVNCLHQSLVEKKRSNEER